jgi:hypothetical protein
MKKITLITLSLSWIFCLTILIIALTDVYPDNIFQSYKLVVGIGFLTISGFIRIAYKKLIETQ